LPVTASARSFAALRTTEMSILTTEMLLPR
jgi:hypothetical protein